jgi:hypothetical protein
MALRVTSDKPGMDVDVQLGVAGQGKQQVVNLDVVDHHAVGFGLASGRGLGSETLC